MAQTLQNGQPTNVTAMATDDVAKRQRPTKTLPTDRITFIKQLDLLRAYAAASSPPGKVVSNNEVAEVFKMKSSTVSLANPFFVSVGFLNKADGGNVPSEGVMQFFRATQWNPDTAAFKLSGILRETWFYQAIGPKLSFRPMGEDEALACLSDACQALPDYKPQLKIILSYLQASGLIEREGDQIRPPKAATAQVYDDHNKPAPEPVRHPESPTPGAASPKPAVTTAFVQSTEGAVNFNVSVRVDMKEFAGWKPDRISAFFNGIAQVLAAKAGVERGAT